MGGLTYSFPYLIVLAILVGLQFVDFRNRLFGRDSWIVNGSALLVLLLFLGLRGFVLTDWLVYYPLFEKMPTFWEGGILSALKPDFMDQFATDETIGKPGTELGFIYFTMLFKSIIPEYHAWVFFNTCINLVLLSFFLKRYSKYFILGLIFFFLFDGMVLEFNLMRNIKAILLFLLSLNYLKKRRIVPYMLLNILGFYFHSSALLFLPLYFLLHKEWNPKIYWTIFIVGVLILLLQVTYVAPLLTWLGGMVGGRLSVLVDLYLMSDLYGGAYGLFHFGYLERVFTFCVLMIFRKQLFEQNEDNVLFVNLFMVFFFIYFYFSEVTVITERVPLLFVAAYWVLYPNIYALIEHKLNKVLFLVIMLMYAAVKLVNANSNVLAKYDNVLFGIESYENRYDTFVNSYDQIVNKDEV
jgi:hypothetical protein